MTEQDKKRQDSLDRETWIGKAVDAARRSTWQDNDPGPLEFGDESAEQIRKPRSVT